VLERALREPTGHDARRMLADVLKRSGELQLAARHLILAGTADAVHDLGRGASIWT
jgi:hypothetical protein